MPGRPMRVQASTARESRHHHRGIRRRPAGASETKRDEEQAINDLRSCFPIKDLGEADFDLGYHTTWDRHAGTLKFDQHHYVRTMAPKFSVEPALAGAKLLSEDDVPQTEAKTEEMRVTPYREAVGALMWAATMTRPDVACAAH